jgi:GDP/UDP-N,N'-diacetylbacillosamine 2-epimerase (hydrolysing)
MEKRRWHMETKSSTLGLNSKIKIGVLTSSRADFGIYLPLLQAIEQDSNFELRLIVFGTHLSKFHGYTLEQIKQEGFLPYSTVESLLIGDSPNAISTSFAITNMKFADFWHNHQTQFDLVFALGDRFEMAAAVMASIPYQIKIAHIAGGETTLGAIDNIYRHIISLSSLLHFVSTEAFKERLFELLEKNEPKIFNIGALGLENLTKLKLLSMVDFYEKWDIDLKIPSILVTIHPETVAFDKNERFAEQAIRAISELATEYQVIITMPNADTSGLIFRKAFQDLEETTGNIKIVENFGTQSYFTAMKHVRILVGNTSSGIVEAASFNKYVINVGDRQKGRICGENVIHVPFDTQQIILKTNEFIHRDWTGGNPYYKEEPSKQILTQIRKLFAKL